jgi:hypothetical protein
VDDVDHDHGGAVAKVTRKKIARGLRLKPEHVFDALDDIKAELEASNIEAEQMERGYAPFEVELNLFCATNEMSGNTWTAPFTLPPLQEYFATQTDAMGNVYPVHDVAAPSVRLEEVHFGFDQRSEPGLITISSTGATNNGKLDFGRVGENPNPYDFKLSLLEKQPNRFYPGTPAREQYVARRSVWSAAIASVNFYSSFDRFNPFVVTEVGVAIDQYSTYVLKLECGPLGGTPAVGVPSVKVRLVFSHPLVARDTSALPTQNLPTKHGGLKTAPTVSYTVPSALDTILADGTKGVETGMLAIDDEFRRGLEGGYDHESEAPPIEELADDAAYSVLTVPMFNGRGYGYIGVDTVDNEPYMIATTDELLCRSVVPLDFPFTIHHVIVGWSWSPGGDRKIPNAAGDDLQVQVGVGVGSGLKGDNFDYEPIASLTIDTPATWESNASVVDLVRGHAWGTGCQSAAGESGERDGEVWALPLVGSGGEGYVTQGTPVFVGRSWLPTSGRANIGGGAPATGGGDQWLEVRCKIDRVAGDLNALTASSIIVGYGGFFVYLIGKRHLG